MAIEKHTIYIAEHSTGRPLDTMPWSESGAAAKMKNLGVIHKFRLAHPATLILLIVPGTLKRAGTGLGVSLESLQRAHGRTQWMGPYVH